MIIKILDFFFLFLINLEKLQMLTHLDPFDVGASRDNAYVLHNCILTQWIFKNKIYVLCESFV